MKLVSQVAKDMFPPNCDGKVVEFISVIGGFRRLDSPTISTDIECSVCSTKTHFTPFVDPSIDSRRVWLCGNLHCETNSVKNTRRATSYQPALQRAILWPKFCEINGIGDEHHGVKFEDVKQSDGKISYLLKFSDKPRGIIFMQGDPGTGKTFASMAVCEMFTRKDTSCIFATQKQMFNKWLDTFKSDSVSNYIDKVSNTSLLVIDDFGTAEMSPGFMSFFMDLINTRMQWSNRGTIITTNLNDTKFSEYCGEALADRINTGQLFEFKGKSKRIKKPL